MLLIVVFAGILATGLRAVGTSNESHTAESQSTEWLGDAKTELVVMVNPLNCRISGNEVRQLNAWHASGRVPVRLHFVGPGATDRRVVAQVVEDLSAEVAVTHASSATMPALWTGTPGRPSVVLKRHGSVVLAIGDIPMASALTIVENALASRY